MADLIPQGTYMATVVGGTHIRSSQKGTEGIRIVFDLVDTGEKVDVTLWLSSAAMQYTEPKLERLGFNWDLTDPKFSLTEPIELNCKHETYNEKTRAKWDFFGSDPFEPGSPEEAARLNAIWKSKRAQPAAPTGRPQAPTSRPSVAAPRHDGIAETDKKRIAQIATGDDAWKFFEDHIIDEQKRTAVWTEATAAINKPEASFTRSDWQKVASAAAIPF